MTPSQCIRGHKRQRGQHWLPDDGGRLRQLLLGAKRPVGTAAPRPIHHPRSHRPLTNVSIRWSAGRMITLPLHRRWLHDIWWIGGCQEKWVEVKGGGSEK